jgi:hypothetical protein
VLLGTVLTVFLGGCSPVCCFLTTAYFCSVHAWQAYLLGKVLATCSGCACVVLPGEPLWLTCCPVLPEISTSPASCTTQYKTGLCGCGMDMG